MTSFPLLDLAIGLCFVYLILSLICTSANEALAGMFKTRAKFLDKGIQRLLDDPKVKEQIYKHQLIRGLSQSDKKVCPSYIPSRNFALALMDNLTGEAPTDDLYALQDAIAAKKENPIGKALAAVLADTSTFAGAQQKIEAWFNDEMDRVTGWYKRHSQIRIAILAILVTIVANADSFKIVKTLWVNPSLRTAFVDAASERIKKGRPDEVLPMVEYPDADNPTITEPINLPERDVASDLEKDLLSQVTGWKDEFAEFSKRTFGSWLGWLLYNRLLGWLITVLAISLGAPFWFDTLSRLVNVRNAGKPPDKKDTGGNTTVINLPAGATK